MRTQLSRQLPGHAPQHVDLHAHGTSLGRPHRSLVFWSRSFWFKLVVLSRTDSRSTSPHETLIVDFDDDCQSISSAVAASPSRVSSPQSGRHPLAHGEAVGRGTGRRVRSACEAGDIRSATFHAHVNIFSFAGVPDPAHFVGCSKSDAVPIPRLARRGLKDGARFTG